MQHSHLLTFFLCEDARFQSALKDNDLKAKLKAWSKGELSEDDLQADPRMQTLIGFVQGELKKKEK